MGGTGGGWVGDTSPQTPPEVTVFRTWPPYTAAAFTWVAKCEGRAGVGGWVANRVEDRGEGVDVDRWVGEGEFEGVNVVR